MVRQPDLDSWQRFFADVGIQPALSAAYVTYAAQLLEANLPVIFDLGHLAALLGRTEAYIASAINVPEKHYRVFRIPKRHGGTRQITAPLPALLECQRWINAAILSQASLHSAAHGFRRRRSILSNARAHAGHRELLKIDIQDFFSSIPIRRVIGVFRHFGYPPNIAFFLARLCCFRDKLPQGAATSPQLSNIIFFKSDTRLFHLAGAFGLTYTRYADDLAFSGDSVPLALTRYVESILREEGFLIRKDKTRLCGPGNRKILTGLLVSGPEPRVPSSFRREVVRDVYYIKKFGYLSHVSNRKIRDPFYLDRLYGRLLYWKHVEKKNEKVDYMLKAVESIIEKYGERES